MQTLVIDSGATKADWALFDPPNGWQTFQTPGIHPFFLDDSQIRRELTAVKLRVGQQIQRVYFYGTGCRAESSQIRLDNAFREVFPKLDEVEIAVDVLGAARALCQRSAGIACILGTGSNSVWYDGSEVVQNTGGYGYILGDEGSGAVMGKELIIAWLNHEMPPDQMQAFEKQFPVSADAVIEKVYRGDTPSRFLASFMPFVVDHQAHPFCRQIILNQFTLFVRRCVKVYAASQHLPVHFTGSVAFHCQSLLFLALEREGLQAGRILQAPLEGLMEYHG